MYLPNYFIFNYYMSSQIFKKSIPIDILFSLLDKICEKTSKYYIIDSNSFRKMNFHEYDTEFYNSLVPYYHKSIKVSVRMFHIYQESIESFVTFEMDMFLREKQER